MTGLQAPRKRLRPVLAGDRGAIALVALVALVVRVVLARAVVHPIPEDTAYYVAAARNLVAGHGLVVDAIWSYTTPPLVFPRPAFEIWLPLPSLLMALPMALLGSGFAVAQLLPVLAGTAVAVVAWRIAADLAEERGIPRERGRRIALVSGLAAAVSLPLLLHSALPDSTTPFTLIALTACLAMPRAARAAAGARTGAGSDASERPSAAGGLGPAAGVGLLIGLAALTRNEAAWLGLAWLATVWWGPARSLPHRARARLVAVAALVAGLVYAPWALRDLLVFGTALPGQAALNALSTRPADIFAWSDPPTLARFLGQGPGAIAAAILEGLRHDLVDVLLLPALPIALVGLAGLPRLVGRGGRSEVLRPLAVLAATTFLVTSLVFPVATTWGTFLHAAGPVHLLLVVAAVAALDDLAAWVGRRRGRPVGRWLPGIAAIAFAASTSFALATVADQATATRDRYERLAALLPALIGSGPGSAPVITDHPIWYADALGSPALALPHEPAASVLSLARTFGARSVVITGETGGAAWAELLAPGGADVACFSPLPLPAGSAPAGVSVWRISCP